MGADLAEDFDTATPVAPGTVVVAVGPDEVAAAEAPLDRRVVGVTSGAGDFQPALRLASKPGEQRVPVAIVGRVHCQADAGFGAIATTSPSVSSPRLGDLSINADVYGYIHRDSASRLFGALGASDVLPGSGTSTAPTTRSLKRHLETI